MSQVCPSCLQPYLHLATLLNPTRTIYVHREVGKGPEKKPVDWCISPNRKGSGNHQSEELKEAIRTAQKINQENIARSLASQSKAVVEFNQGQQHYEEYQKYVMAQTIGKRIAQVQAQREITSMPFIGFDFAKLKEEFPPAGVGRAGKPSIAISHQGRITMSSEVSKAMEGCVVVMPSKDKENPQRIRFDGHSAPPKGKENSVVELVRPKPSKKDGKVHSKSVTINGALLLKALKYDFAKAGDHTYEVEKFDVEKHIVVFSLPATLPTPKPKKERKKKEVKAPAAATSGGTTNGAASANAGAGGAATPATPPAAASAGGDDVVIDE